MLFRSHHTAWAAQGQAIAIWTIREYGKSLHRLEEDYVALANECETLGIRNTAIHLREEIALLLDADWKRQNTIIAARKAKKEAEWEQRRKEREKKRAEMAENLAKVPAAQVERLRKDGIDPKELIEGKPFKATTAAGRALHRFLTGTKWNNSLGVLYEWDELGRLWITPGPLGKRIFIYAEYCDGQECILRSSHWEVNKLLVDKAALKITPQRPSGRPERSLSRVED